MAQKQRARSSWKLNQGLLESDGLIGQKGRDFASIYAVHAMAAARRIWQQPRASRGCVLPRVRNDPILLPIPRPTRNTAKIIENV